MYGLTAFIESLPSCPPVEKGKLAVIDTSIDDKNICTVAQVKAMNAKNWEVYCWHLTDEKIYEGSQADTAESGKISAPN